MKQIFQHARYETVPLFFICAMIRSGDTPGQLREVVILEASMIPAAIVLEGEVTGSASSVSISGVNNCESKRVRYQAGSKICYKFSVV